MNWNTFIKNNDLEVSKIQKIKFDEEDIYIFVKWMQVHTNYKIIIHKKIGTCKKAIKRKNMWCTTIKSSWIRLTDLDLAGKHWDNFYMGCLWPAISNRNNNKKTLIIKKADS